MIGPRDGRDLLERHAVRRLGAAHERVRKRHRFLRTLQLEQHANVQELERNVLGSERAHAFDVLDRILEPAESREHVGAGVEELDVVRAGLEQFVAGRQGLEVAPQRPC